MTWARWEGSARPCHVCLQAPRPPSSLSARSQILTWTARSFPFSGAFSSLFRCSGLLQLDARLVPLIPSPAQSNGIRVLPNSLHAGSKRGWVGAPRLSYGFYP
jgi:hypothetical protein